jgi:hypothetical protein
MHVAKRSANVYGRNVVLMCVCLQGLYMRLGCVGYVGRQGHEGHRRPGANQGGLDTRIGGLHLGTFIRGFMCCWRQGANAVQPARLPRQGADTGARGQACTAEWAGREWARRPEKTAPHRMQWVGLERMWRQRAFDHR